MSSLQAYYMTRLFYWILSSLDLILIVQLADLLGTQ